VSHTPFPPIVDRGETVTGTGGHRLRSWATAVVALLSTVLGLFPSTSMVWPGSQTACADVAVTVAVNPDHTPTAHLLDYRITAGHSHGPPATINGPAANGHTYYVLAGNTPVLVHNCNIVYRGLAEGEDPAVGLTARNPGAGNDIVSHIAGARDSQWISTTRSEAVARDVFGKNGYVRIDLSKVGNEIVDVSKGIPGMNPNYMLSRWARKMQEVLVQGYIPPEAIG
jgi:hypothetical protein